MTKDLMMFLGLVAGFTDGEFLKSYDETINDPLFQMMCEEDKYDTESTKETSNS